MALYLLSLNTLESFQRDENLQTERQWATFEREEEAWRGELHVTSALAPYTGWRSAQIMLTFMLAASRLWNMTV